MANLTPLDLTDEGTGKTVETPSGTIYYNEAGSGPVLLMLHGSGPGATGWSNFGGAIKQLANDFRCIAVDMPGWGRSAEVTFEKRNHCETALEIIDALGIDKVALIGNSMGGMTALQFSARHPERTSHLITMGPGAPGVRYFGAGDGPTEGLKLLQAGYVDPSPKSIRRMVNIFTYDKDFATDALIAQRSAAAMANPNHLKNHIESFGKFPKNRLTMEECMSISAPALLIHGRDDRVVHYENTLFLVSAIPNSRAVILNRCGHWAMLEHLNEFCRLVADFVENN